MAISEYIVKTATTFLILAGVDNRRYYSEGRDATGVAALAKLGDEADYDAREEVFAKNRGTLQNKFRFAVEFVTP